MDILFASQRTIVFSNCSIFKPMNYATLVVGEIVTLEYK
jgi:hypothetical protein